MALALILTLSFVLVGVAAGEDDLEPDPERGDLDGEGFLNTVCGKSKSIYKGKLAAYCKLKEACHI